MQANRPKDQTARDLCALPGAQNIIVEAGAGTGKTTILIERLCYLILGKEISIDKIIALTFTEKAAAEIKIRLLSKMQRILLELSKNETKDNTTLTLLNHFKKTKEDLQKNMQIAFELAERAQISTIHSFCLQILRRYPLEAGLAPQAAVDDGIITQNIIDKAWAAMLEEQLVFDAPFASAWREVLAQIPLEDIKDFAQTLLTPGLENYRPLASSPQIKEHCLTRARRARELAGKYDAPKKRAVETALETAALMLEESADFFASLKPVKSKYNLEKDPSKPVNWDEDDFEQAESLIDFARAVKTDNQILIMKVYGLIMPFVNEVKEQIRRENILSYDDIIYKTKNLLKTNKTAREELKKEYQSILVDEFQDTDPQQGEILLFLAERGASAADNWQDIKLEPGKLFTVGDPKQSIYRFRGADIAAYQKFTDLMATQGAQKCFLQTNFRSSKNIIAFANNYGERMIEGKAGIQPEYVPIDAGKEIQAPKVLLAAVKADEGAKEPVNSYRHNQAQFIAAWIKDNAGKTKLANGKTMALKDIAILLRTTTTLDIYTDALKRFDVKYTVEETKNFYNAQEVSDIINILKALNDPADKTALLAVLRSPFAMVADGDILKLSRENALNIFADARAAPAAQKAYDKLKNLYYKAGRAPLDNLLSEIIYDTGFCELETLAAQKEQAVANILKFAAVARAAQGAGALSLGQFLFYAENYSKEQKKEGESPLAEESLDTVSVMTMHKAKGLEFPVIFLADINKKETARQGRRPSYIYDWDSGDIGLRLGQISDGAFAILEENAKHHEAAQELRVLYVALTRAKEQLIITGDLKEDKNSISHALLRAGCWPAPDFGQDSILTGAARADIIYPPHQPLENFIDKQYGAQIKQSAAFDIPAWLGAWQKRTAAFKAAQNTTGPGAAYEDAAITGIICHRMLFNIFTGSAKDARRAALEENINPADYPQQLGEAAQIITAFEQSDIYKKLKSMRLLAAEMPFTMQDKDGQITSGVIDAVFEKPDGGLFIADYKSDNIKAGEIAKRGALYKEQIEFYKEAVAKMRPGAKIQAAIIYLRLQEENLFYV